MAQDEQVEMVDKVIDTLSASSKMKFGHRFIAENINAIVNSEIESTCKKMRQEGQCFSKFYVDHSLPVLSDRLELTMTSAPITHQLITFCIKSANYVQEHRANDNKIKSNKKLCYWTQANVEEGNDIINLMNSDNEMKHDKLGKQLIETYYKHNSADESKAIEAMRIVESLVGHRLNGRGVVPSNIELGVLLYLSNTTFSTQELLSSMGICSSPTVNKAIVDGLIKDYKEENWRLISDCVGDPCSVMGLIIDNYCVKAWINFVLRNNPFSIISNSISGLFKILYLSPSTKFPGMTPTAPTFSKLDVPRLISALNDPLQIPDAFKNLKDEQGVKYQGLNNYRVLENWGKKSSSFSDVSEIVDQDFIGKFGMAIKPLPITTDCEFTAHWAKLLYRDANMIKNLAPMPSLFHDNKHIEENLMTDPLLMMLIIFPYFIDCFQLQV